MTRTRDAKELAQRLRKEGYQITLNGSTHYRASHDTHRYDFPLSPSDTRSLTNACSDLRRNGFVFTFRGKRWAKPGLLSPAEQATREREQVRAEARANIEPEPEPEPEPATVSALKALDLVLPGRFKAVDIPAVKRWLAATERLLELR